MIYASGFISHCRDASPPPPLTPRRSTPERSVGDLFIREEGSGASGCASEEPARQRSRRERAPSEGRGFSFHPEQGRALYFTRTLPRGGTRLLRLLCATEEGGLLFAGAADRRPNGGWGARGDLGAFARRREGRGEQDGRSLFLRGRAGCGAGMSSGLRGRGLGRRVPGQAVGVFPMSWSRRRDHPGAGAGEGKATCNGEEDEVPLRKGMRFPPPRLSPSLPDAAACGRPVSAGALRTRWQIQEG